MRHFLSVVAGVVVGHLEVGRETWAGVAIAECLVEVSGAVFAAVADGWIQQSDGTFAPPEATAP